MGKHVNIFLSDKMVEQLDDYLLIKNVVVPKPLTMEERKAVHKIADDKGVASANAYLRIIRPPQVKLSRTSLVEYLVEIGIEGLSITDI
jgi:hypothetical protein